MVDDALYEPDGDAFVGTPLTEGGWSPDAQSGGAVLALLGHVIEDVPTLMPMSLSRLTVDLVRPVPIGRPLRIEPMVVREGKKIQVVDLRVFTEDADHVRARVLRIRDADVDGTDVPESSTDADPARHMPPPADLDPADDLPGLPAFLRTALDFRRTDSARHDVNGIWTRLRVAVVAGEPVRATSRVAVPMDVVNLIGIRDLRGFTGINPDVSAHVVRPPVGDWVGLVGETVFAPDVGHGVSAATLSDEQGVLGITSTSQLLDRYSP